ncbi:hypothetical protein NQ317_018653 [Molorchus minor]|uniref:Uncharacterized protein n=1 Tax=Molorchus minor TaxID=1323400 RepID=A0ABQ9IVP0_9CUCU|nr:hypothetical protein NQ317_018653 [Molorchus minor]
MQMPRAPDRIAVFQVYIQMTIKGTGELGEERNKQNLFSEIEKDYKKLKKQFDNVCRSGGVNVKDELLEEAKGLIQEKKEVLGETSKVDLDGKIDELVSQRPEVTSYVEVERLKLHIYELEQQLEIEQKQEALLIDDNTDKYALIEKLVPALKEFYKILRGHGYITTTLTKQYQELLHLFQGRKNVTWGEMPDSGVSSTSSLAMTDDEIKRNNYKRKIEEQSPDLDMTYTMSVNITPNKPKVKMCAEQLLSKVLKPPPPKRIASGMSPRSPRNKENKTVRRAFGAVDGSRAFAAGKSKSILKGMCSSLFYVVV